MSLTVGRPTKWCATAQWPRIVRRAVAVQVANLWYFGCCGSSGCVRVVYEFVVELQVICAALNFYLLSFPRRNRSLVLLLSRNFLSS